MHWIFFFLSVSFSSFVHAEAFANSQDVSSLREWNQLSVLSNERGIPPAFTADAKAAKTRSEERNRAGFCAASGVNRALASGIGEISRWIFSGRAKFSRRNDNARHVYIKRSNVRARVIFQVAPLPFTRNRKFPREGGSGNYVAISIETWRTRLERSAFSLVAEKQTPTPLQGEDMESSKAYYVSFGWD